MPEISWIKVLTNIRKNKKILLIKAMPEGDALFCIWIDLICMAGEVNDNGYIYINKEVPYTDEELGIVLDRPPVIIRLALSTFLKYKMVDVDENGFILLNGFSEIQSVEGMTKIRELGAARQHKFRQKVKLFPAASENQGNNKGDNTSLVTLRDVTVTQQIRVEKNRIEKSREEVLQIWNNVLDKIKVTVNPANYETWFKDASCIEINESEIVIGVEREDQAAHIEQSKSAIIEKIVTEVTGKSLKLKIVLLETVE